MQMIRTLFWVALTAALMAFVWMNQEVVRLNLWPVDLSGTFTGINLPLGLIALAAFVAGMVPMWLYHRAHRWGAKRRIASLETELRTATPPPPLATATQLEAAQKASDPHP